MNRRLKLTAIIAPLTLAALALGGYAYTRAHAAPTYRLANGIEVTPTVNPQDETAQLLEVKSWDFDITQPDAGKPLYVSIALYKKGKFVKIIGGGIGVGPAVLKPLPKGPLHSQESVSFAPIGGTFFTAPKLKYLITIKGNGTPETMPTPALKGNSHTEGMQVIPEDNAVLILSTNQTLPYCSSVLSENQTTLAVKFSETPPEH